MEQNTNERIVYLDLLRILATFAVIFLHVSAWEVAEFSFSSTWYISLFYDSLVRWCVPVFVMISGVLYLNPAKEISYNEILKNRIPRLFIAYVFWSIIYAFYGFIMDGFENFSIVLLIKQSILSHFHLWFLPMLMGVYLLIPIIRKIAQDKKLMQYTLILWIVFVGISFFDFISIFKLVQYFNFLFQINCVIGFSGYFLLGYYISQHKNNSRKQKNWIWLLGLLGLLIIIAGTIYTSIKNGATNERYFNNLSIQVVAMSIAVFVFAMSAAQKCKKYFLKINKFISKDLFGVYLTHALWLPVVNTAVFRHSCSVIISIPLISIAVFVLSLLTTKLIRLVPFLRKVVE